MFAGTDHRVCDDQWKKRPRWSLTRNWIMPSVKSPSSLAQVTSPLFMDPLHSAPSFIINNYQVLCMLFGWGRCLLVWKEEWVVLILRGWNKQKDTLRTGCKSIKKARELCGSKLLYHGSWLKLCTMEDKETLNIISSTFPSCQYISLFLCA